MINQFCFSKPIVFTGALVNHLFWFAVPAFSFCWCISVAFGVRGKRRNSQNWVKRKMHWQETIREEQVNEYSRRKMTDCCSGRKWAFLFAKINCKMFTFKQVNSIFFLQVEKKWKIFLKTMVGLSVRTGTLESLSKIKLLSLRKISDPSWNKEITLIAVFQYFTAVWFSAAVFFYRNILPLYIAVLWLFLTTQSRGCSSLRGLQQKQQDCICWLIQLIWMSGICKNNLNFFSNMYYFRINGTNLISHHLGHVCRPLKFFPAV